MKPLHVVMISTDRTIFDAGSPARKRMEEYAAAFGKLSIIIFAKRGSGFQASIGVPLSLYPTNSWARLAFIRDAVNAGLHFTDADVVTTQDPFETGKAGARLARRLGVPLHVQVHTDFLAPGFTSIHWPLNALRASMAPSVLREAARIRAVSERIKEHVEKRFAPKAPLSVLPIFVDTKAFEGIPRTKHPKFKTALLVVSRLEKEKRIDVTLSALKQARDAGIDAGLDIVGSGREEKTLRVLSSKLGVAEYVEFHGLQKDVAPYYAQADTLLSPGALYEGFGVALVEGLAAGVPVLSFDVGIAREAGAEIAPGSTAGDFGAALITLLQKPPENRPHLLLYRPYASKEEYLAKLKADLTIPPTHG